MAIPAILIAMLAGAAMGKIRSEEDKKIIAAEKKRMAREESTAALWKHFTKEPGQFDRTNPAPSEIAQIMSGATMGAGIGQQIKPETNVAQTTTVPPGESGGGSLPVQRMQMNAYQNPYENPYQQRYYNA